MHISICPSRLRFLFYLFFILFPENCLYVKIFPLFVSSSFIMLEICCFLFPAPVPADKSYIFFISVFCFSLLFPFFFLPLITFVLFWPSQQIWKHSPNDGGVVSLIIKTRFNWLEHNGFFFWWRRYSLKIARHFFNTYQGLH